MKKNKPIHIGFTGTRMGMTNEQHNSLKRIFTGTNFILHNGQCEGADFQAYEMTKKFNQHIVLHPPKDKKYKFFNPERYPFETVCKPKDYLKRNKDIVNDSEILIAVPKESNEVLRSGTWSTVRYARKKKGRVVIIYPSGKIEIE